MEEPCEEENKFEVQGIEEYEKHSIEGEKANQDDLEKIFNV